MTTTENLLALVRTSSTRYQSAVTLHIESGDTCTMLVLGDGSDWDDGVPAAYFARLFYAVAKGAAVGQWQPVPVTDEIASAIASAVSGGLTGYASITYVDAAIAAIPSDDDSGRCAVPGAGGSVTPVLSTPRRPSTTRPVRVTAYGTIALTSTLLTAQSATVELLADSSSTPTTSVSGPVAATLSGVVASMTVPWAATYDVPTGHYYQLSKTAGAGTVAVTHVNETTL